MVAGAGAPAMHSLCERTGERIGPTEHANQHLCDFGGGWLRRSSCLINYRIFGIIGPTSRVIKYGIRVGDNSILGFIGVIPVIGMSQKRSLSEPIRISIVIGSHGSIPIGDRTQRTATNIMLIILSYRPFSIPLSSCLASFVSFRYI